MTIGVVPKNQGFGQVKDAAARFTRSKWDEIQAVRGPVSNDWPGFGFWFNYFWDEAVTVPSLSNSEKQMLIEAFHGVIEKAGTVWQLKTDGASTDSYHRLKTLRSLLHIGFVRVPYESSGARGYRPNPATDAPSLFTEVVNFSRTGGSVSPMKIGWRSDARAYETLVSQDGFQARARQDKVNTEWNLDKPWHPYSLDVYKNAIYLRKGQNRDNCLHTAVSIGTDFKQLVHFPIFTDLALYQPPLGPITDTWTREVVVNGKGQTARVGSDPLGKFLEHDTQVYGVRIGDSMQGYHTENFQAVAGKDPFPERSVNAIPLSSILALVIITRKYWWDNSSRATNEHHWQLFDVECKETRILNPFLLKFLSGDTAPGILESHIKYKLTEAKNRPDIVGDRNKRVRELSPKPVATQAAATTVVCPICGEKFPNTMKLNFHNGQKHRD